MSEAPACVGPHPRQRPRHSFRQAARTAIAMFSQIQEISALGRAQLYAAVLPLEHYPRMCETVGPQRTVQVNASVYGFDNTLSSTHRATSASTGARRLPACVPMSARMN